MVELVDSIAERIQLLGGVSIAMAPDVAETTRIDRPPRGREEVPVQLSRLLDAHQTIIPQTRKLVQRAVEIDDDGTNDPSRQRSAAHERTSSVVFERTFG